MSAKQEQGKPETYVPELDLSKLKGVMDKSWFLEQIVFQVKDEVKPEQSELAF